MHDIVEIKEYFKVNSSLRSDVCSERALDKYTRGRLRIDSSIMTAEFEVVLSIALVTVFHSKSA